MESLHFPDNKLPPSAIIKRLTTNSFLLCNLPPGFPGSDSAPPSPSPSGPLIRPELAWPLWWIIFHSRGLWILTR